VGKGPAQPPDNRASATSAGAIHLQAHEAEGSEPRGRIRAHCEKGFVAGCHGAILPSVAAALHGRPLAFARCLCRLQRTTDRFRADKGFSGTEGATGRTQGPVQVHSGCCSPLLGHGRASIVGARLLLLCSLSAATMTSSAWASFSNKQRKANAKAVVVKPAARTPRSDRHAISTTARVRFSGRKPWDRAFPLAKPGMACCFFELMMPLQCLSTLAVALDSACTEKGCVFQPEGGGGKGGHRITAECLPARS
jgi:hypothetical protein